jgi:putative ABC transport system permease protein
VSLATAVAEANVVGHQLRGSTPEPGAPPRFEIAPLQDEMVAPVRPALRVLVVAVGVVLLIVCANVANLLLARVARRQQEIAIRRSVGATPSRIVRQILTESVVLGVVGGLAGVGFAELGVRVLKAVASINLPPNGMPQLPGADTILPRLGEVSVNPAVLAFALAVSLLAGILFGMAPALGSRQLSSAARGSKRTRTSNVLAVAQLALATTLLVGAGLLLNSFRNLTSQDLGFDTNGVLRFGVVVPQHYPADWRLDVVDRVVERLKALPGVEAVGYTDAPPFSPGSSPGNGVYEPPRIEADEDLRGDTVPEYRMASADYLRAMGARLVDGRWYDEEDRAASPPSVLVTRWYAQYYFGDQNPIGTVFNARSGVPTPMVVVGIIDDIHLLSVEGDKPTSLFIDPFHSLAKARSNFAARGRPLSDGYSREFLTRMGGTVAFAARVTNGDPMRIAAELPAVVRQIDPSAAVEGAMPMSDLLSGATARPRFYAVVVGFFGSIAAFLAVIGIYGVLAYAATQRTQEFGIRLALGAKRGDVLNLVLRQGVIMAAIGIPVGIGGAVGVTRYLETMLFGLTSLDIRTYVAVVITFAAVALLAAYIPARRATRVDPVIALRHD